MFKWERNEKNMNLFIDKHERNLPIKGWIHSCISCSLPTGYNYSYYKDNNVTITVSICKYCINHNHIPHIKINHQINLRFNNIFYNI